MKLNEKYDYNPYTPAFGISPIAYIHRHKEEEQILNDFCNPHKIPMSYMIIGARGMGKTVLMHEIANQFEEFPDWVVVRMNPNVNMLESLMNKLVSHNKISSIVKSAKLNLSFFELGYSKETNPVIDEEYAITEIIKKMDKEEKRLLIIVDEATNTDSMKIFASTYQNLIGQKLPVYLLMTGLYEHINTLKNEKNLTFLYRMPRILLAPLGIYDIADNYKDVFCLNEDESLTMAQYTRGYSYAFQLLGKLAWENKGDYKGMLDDYKNDLYDMVYEKIWDEMSNLDRQLIYAVIKSKDGSVKSIMETIGWTKNKLSPYRDRLIKKGLLLSPRHGYLEIAMPFFKAYVLRNYVDVMPAENLPDDL